MAKGVILKTEYSTDKFISNIFLVPKKNGKLRPVINLRQLKEFVEYHHFKQENLKFVLDLVPKFDYLTSVDLCDAYFSIQIIPEFQKYLCFSWKNQYYVFRVLPFGLVQLLGFLLNYKNLYLHGLDIKESDVIIILMILYV